jgi:hypothetical protein
VGLTLIFAVSGIAVNHVEDWNPNYNISKTIFHIPPLSAEDLDQVVSIVLNHLNIEESPQSSFRASPEVLQIFLENKKIELNLSSGKGVYEVVQKRFLLYSFNFLHLNHAKGWWTWFSDIYAVLLIFLAISGMFVLKGKNGLTGRGKWFVVLGILIPIVFLIMH